METAQSPPPGEQSGSQEGNKTKRTQLIEEVVKRADQQRLSNSKSDQLDTEFAKLKREYGQTHESVSFYSLLEHFRELSLLEDT